MYQRLNFPDSFSKYANQHVENKFISYSGEGNSFCGYDLTITVLKMHDFRMKSKKISNDQELIQSDPTFCPQNQKGNN